MLVEGLEPDDDEMDVEIMVDELLNAAGLSVDDTLMIVAVVGDCGRAEVNADVLADLLLVVVVTEPELTIVLESVDSSEDKLLVVEVVLAGPELI